MTSYNKKISILILAVALIGTAVPYYINKQYHFVDIASLRQMSSSSVSFDKEMGTIEKPVLSSVTEQDFIEMVNIDGGESAAQMKTKISDGSVVLLEKGTKFKVMDAGLVSTKIVVADGSRNGSMYYIPTDKIFADPAP